MNLRRRLFSLLLLLPVATFAVPWAPSAENAKEILPGRDYLVLPTPLPTSTGDRIEVREFFYYACTHCFALEPHLEQWLKSKPADVQLVRTPAVLNPQWAILGRAYYVGEELQVLAKTHAAIYNSIHVGNQRYPDQKSVAKLFETVAGVPAAKFDAAWKSFAVDTKLRNADALARKYQVTGTPTFAVAGKYVVPAAGNRTFEIINFLVNKERAAIGKKQ